MAAFRDFLGDDEPTTEQLAVGAFHALANDLAEFVVLGDPIHSYVQLRYIWSAWHLSEVCWVEDVYVADSQRGRGVGRALMAFAEERVSRERDCERDVSKSSSCECIARASCPKSDGDTTAK